MLRNTCRKNRLENNVHSRRRTCSDAEMDRSRKKRIENRNPSEYVRRFSDMYAKNRLSRMRMLGTIDAEQFCAVPTAIGKREFPGSDRSVAYDPRTSSDGPLAGA